MRRGDKDHLSPDNRRLSCGSRSTVAIELTPICHASTSRIVSSITWSVSARDREVVLECTAFGVLLHAVATETRHARAFLTLCLVLASAACSLVVDKNATQCVRDEDCRVAPFTTCAASVCVDPKAQGMSGNGSCTGNSGCYRCAPQNNVQFLNACTDRSCVPFDNARLRNLAADGKLKPLLSR